MRPDSTGRIDFYTFCDYMIRKLRDPESYASNVFANKLVIFKHELLAYLSYRLKDDFYFKLKLYEVIHQVNREETFQLLNH